MNRETASDSSALRSLLARATRLAISAIVFLAAGLRTAGADSLFVPALFSFGAEDIPHLTGMGDSTGRFPGPRPNSLFQFQKDNRRHPWLRVNADSGWIERKVRRIDSIGLHDLSARDGRRLPESIPWTQVQRIDEVVTRAAGWRTVGAVTLGLLGAGLGNALGAPNQSGGPMAMAGLLAFGGVGAYLGGEYGSRFRSERNWYVADTMRRAEPVERPAALDPGPLAADPAAVLSACNRIGRNERFRAYGSFGSFQGSAGIVGPEGLEALSVDRHRPRGARANAPQRITWDQIDRIEMRGGSAMNGALAGGAAFAALGALVGMAAVAAASGGSDASVAEGAFGGAAILAPVGIVLGGLTGAAARRWVSVYQRR